MPHPNDPKFKLEALPEAAPEGPKLHASGLTEAQWSALVSKHGSKLYYLTKSPEIVVFKKWRNADFKEHVVHTNEGGVAVPAWWESTFLNQVVWPETDVAKRALLDEYPGTSGRVVIQLSQLAHGETSDLAKKG